MIDVYSSGAGDAPGNAWVEQIVLTVQRGEGSAFEGTLSVIFTGDEQIISLNRDFFNKDRPTDVIAFNLQDEADDVWGEIYISLERAAEQAAEWKVSRQEETARLLIHGLLHLYGYDDLQPETRGAMTAKEDHYLNLLQKDGLL